jgi:hypothetical protein
MTAIGMLVSLALLLTLGYFFFCCTVTIGLWLRERLQSRRVQEQQYRTLTVR